jgi:hypothetical protein
MTPVIDRVFPLAEAARAHAYLEFKFPAGMSDFAFTVQELYGF